MRLPMFRKGQQYDCKWYIPLADVTFQTIDESESSPVPQIPEEEIDCLKVRISQIKNEIQREKVDECINQKCSSTANHQLGVNCSPSLLAFILICVQRVCKGGKVLDRLRKKLCEQESLLLLMSPCMAFRVSNRNGKVNQKIS